MKPIKLTHLLTDQATHLKINLFYLILQLTEAKSSLLSETSTKNGLSTLHNTFKTLKPIVHNTDSMKISKQNNNH